MKYRVTILEHLNHQVEVEADDEDAACKVACGAFVASDKAVWFEATDVEPIEDRVDAVTALRYRGLLDD